MRRKRLSEATLRSILRYRSMGTPFDVCITPRSTDAATLPARTLPPEPNTPYAITPDRGVMLTQAHGHYDRLVLHGWNR